LTRPRRLTALERATLSPEHELELLIAEQEHDERRSSWADTPPWQWSLDAPSTAADGMSGTVGADLVGRDPWELVDSAIDLGLDPGEVAYSGDIVDSTPPSRGLLRGRGLIDSRSIPHGTAGGYQNHKCRCIPCTNAWATYKRERRAARKAAA
jgi:hypothetical protein